MATRELRNQIFSAKNGEPDEEEEKWITHYSSNHQILLVGDGDFSFSLSLANAFTSASNICASSLDSYDSLVKKYKNAKSNLEKLGKLGAFLLHGVDATKMKHHTYLANRKFDRIIFNFPHAGFHGREDNAHMIQMHRKLVQGFFRNARGMLRANGEIHVNHKTSVPFSLWNLEELASGSSLVLIQCVDFKIQDYPGYHNKRGDSLRCDQPFPLGESSTFKFIFHHGANNLSNATSRLGSMRGEYRHFQTIPMPMQFQPASEFNYPQRTHIVNHIPLHAGLPPTIPYVNQYSRVLDRNLNSLVPTYQTNSYGVDYPQRLRHGLDRHTIEIPRASNGNLFYKHENEQVRHSLDKQMLEFPRTLNGSLYYMHEHEQVRHSLHRQMVDVPRTLNGNLYYMHEHDHERVQHSLDRQMVEAPRTWNRYLYNLHEHEHDRVRHILDRQRGEVPRTMNNNLCYMHGQLHGNEQITHTLDRPRVEVPRTLNGSSLYSMNYHENEIHHIGNSMPHLNRRLACQAYQLNAPTTRDVLHL